MEPDLSIPSSCWPDLAANIVILTGAGISADSGLTPFRGGSSDTNEDAAIWARFDFHKVATPEAFAADPHLVHEFYNLRRAGVVNAVPNAAHHALVDLENAIAAAGGTFTLVSQNVDDLHKRAGSHALLAMHGEIMNVFCLNCSASFPQIDNVSPETRCEQCGVQGGVRPDVVWFGETPRFMDRIDEAMEKADLFVSIGTSGTVYPAAGLVEIARSRFIPTLELSLEPSENASLFSGGIYGPANEIVPAWVSQTLAHTIEKNGA